MTTNIHELRYKQKDLLKVAGISNAQMNSWIERGRIRLIRSEQETPNVTRRFSLRDIFVVTVMAILTRSKLNAADVSIVSSEIADRVIDWMLDEDGWYGHHDPQNFKKYSIIYWDNLSRHFEQIPQDTTEFNYRDRSGHLIRDRFYMVIDLIELRKTVLSELDDL